MSQPLASETSRVRSASGSSISKKGLTVNAAFLKDIKDDNRDLKILIDRLKWLTASRPIAANHWPELKRLWSDLRDQLAMHFGLEEAYGYFEHAIDPCSELSSHAESLRSQHADLFEMVRSLAESASDAATVDPAEVMEGRTPEVTAAQDAVLDRWQGFWFLFQRHEEAELKVILDSLDRDLGTGD